MGRASSPDHASLLGRARAQSRRRAQRRLVTLRTNARGSSYVAAAMPVLAGDVNMGRSNQPSNPCPRRLLSSHMCMSASAPGAASPAPAAAPCCTAPAPAVPSAPADTAPPPTTHVAAPDSGSLPKSAPRLYCPPARGVTAPEGSRADSAENEVWCRSTSAAAPPSVPSSELRRCSAREMRWRYRPARSASESVSRARAHAPDEERERKREREKRTYERGCSWRSQP
mgnify:CR=1 FL=1